MRINNSVNIQKPSYSINSLNSLNPNNIKNYNNKLHNNCIEFNKNISTGFPISNSLMNNNNQINMEQNRKLIASMNENIRVNNI